MPRKVAQQQSSRTSCGHHRMAWIGTCCGFLWQPLMRVAPTQSLMKLTGLTVGEVDEEGRPTGATPSTNEVLEALKDEVMRQLKVGHPVVVPSPRGLPLKSSKGKSRIEHS